MTNVSEFSNKIAKGAIIVFFGMLISKVLAYLYVALLARLGSSNYGLISLSLAILSFVSTFAGLGLKTGITRYISYYKGKEDNKRIKGSILSSIQISLPLSLILMILLFVFSEKISVLIFHNIELTFLLRILSLTLPLITMSDILLGIIIGFQRIEYRVLIKDILENFIRLIFTFIVIYLGYKLIGVAVVYILSFVITTILSFCFLQKKIFPFVKTNVIPKLLTKELLIFSYPLIFVGIFTLFIKWTDVLIIGFFRSTSEVGIYNVALPTANLLVIIPTAFMSLFMPVITELYSKKKFSKIILLSRINSKWIFFLNFPIFLLIFLFSKDILRLMFGAEYMAGSSALLILIFGYMVHSLTHIHTAVLTTIKKTKLILYISLLSATSNILLCYLLIPKYGIIGGSIATSFSFILSYLLYSRITYKLVKVQPLKLSYIKSILSGVISFFIVSYLISFFNNLSFVLFVLFSLLFLIIYSSLIYLLKGFDKEDIEVIKNFYLKFKGLRLFNFLND